MATPGTTESRTAPASPEALRQELAAFRSSHPLSRLKVEGIEWEYLLGGSGPASVVLLPGGLGVGDIYFRLFTRLGKTAKVLSPSYPGGIASMRQLAAGAMALAEHEGLGPLKLLGSSFGGWVAQVMARDYPARVRRLVLANTCGPDAGLARHYRREESAWRRMPRFLDRSVIPALMLCQLAPPREHRAFWRWVLRDIYAHPDIHERTASIFRCSADFLGAAFDPGEVAARAGSVFILESELDTIIGRSAREALKAMYPGAYVHTFRGAGHTVSYHRPEEYDEALESCLGA